MGILMDQSRCTGCGCCLDACDEGALELSQEPMAPFEQPSCDEDICILCEKCLELCPAGALSLSQA